MRIVTPYGRSRTEIRRALRLKPALTEERAIPDFARSDDRLTIAQWISAIDKIARKPEGEDRPTEEQRAFRERLGMACWKLIADKRLLNGNLPEGIDAETLWRSKLHPYGKREPKKPLSPKGRWYRRFAGEAAPEAADVEAVARGIYEHLYEAEYRLAPGSKSKRQGRIAARAESIESNVLKQRPRGDNAGWTDDDVAAWRTGDVAAAIHKAAQEREARKRRVDPDLAAGHLHGHYARLFGAVPIKQAQREHPGQFALHMAAKDCYRRLLKDRRKTSVLHILPANADALLALIGRQARNRDLGHLIRLGKIVHYEDGGDVEQSRCWTSDGQAEIKRNEAFVRVWRHALALMQRTATDLADPEGSQGADILASQAIATVTGEAFPRDSFDARLELLFGSRAGLFRPLDPEDAGPRKAVLKAMLDGLAKLRNSAFHFKGLGGFAASLEDLGTVGEAVQHATDELWRQDVQGRAARLGATLAGAHADRFLKQNQAHKLLAALAGAAPATLPLPRFNRVVARAENTWKGKQSLSLPDSVNRRELEASPALHCQYVCLKLLYERPFRAWVEEADAETLNGFIARAVERATREARNINAKNKDEKERALVVAKAAALGGLPAGQGLADFFFRLSAATATEMRVQRGYESDAEQAQKQAGFIEDLKCELLALAFDTWLASEGFGFLTGLKKTETAAADPLWTADDIGTPEAPEDDAEPWQRHLYCLLHMAPVGAVSSLLHQMRKWDLLAGPQPSDDKARAARVMAVLELWLDMHDAKFEGGGAAIREVDSLAPLYERREDFDAVFPATGRPDDDRRIPVRGLRELLRFGHLKPLMPIFEKHKVTAGEVAGHCRDDAPGADGGPSRIAACQMAREQLHKKWVDKKISREEIGRYEIILGHVTAHRHRAARVLLTDHARLHDLTMAVLGRLVDYAGLFERDLYFATRALLHEAGLRPQDIFRAKGVRLLGEGRVLEALTEVLHSPADGGAMVRKLETLFNLPVTRGLRNRFAHFNMLRGNEPLDLTREVNDARTLMAHDRKLRNAVAKSVIELLAREGLCLRWRMGPDHNLRDARLATRQATHLDNKNLKEPLHGDAYVRMAATLFGGSAEQPREPTEKSGSKGPKHGTRHRA